ncbi:MAG: hypothetical protein M3124_03890 [Actinomycetota bacterium]|nr:hypothetical protein [Actinomycetota bacterium]
MPPGRWTALFFLDEATALAAGHRPCAYCRRTDFISFAECWRGAHGLAERPRALHIDAQLHTERVDSRTRRQLTRTKSVGELPGGVMVRYRGTTGLLLRERVLPWSFDGYGAPIEIAKAASVEMLTPPATAATIAGGYRPLLHPSAEPGS